MTALQHDQPASETTIDIARATAASGLRVLPIKPGAQHPPMNSWQNAASTEERTIAAWWNGLYRTHGIGIAMGPQPDGRIVFAIDIDQHDPAKDGFEELDDLEAEHGKLPDTVISLTGGGGQHRLFEAPRGSIIRNQQNNGNRVAPGIDIRGDGGQIVVSPTVHPKSGRRYEWDEGHAPWEIEIAQAPAWLLERVLERPTAPKPAPTPSAGTQTSLAAVQGDSIAEEMRNDWNWQHELSRLGWTQGHASGSDTYWTRPGKEVREGHSAVLHGDDCIVIFTTDIPQTWLQAGTATHDGSGWSFSPFGFYAATQHNGDRSQAARTLRTEANAREAATVAGIPAAIATGNTDDVPDAPDEPTYDELLLNMLVKWPTFWQEDHGDAEWLAEPVIAAHRSTALFAPGGTGKSLLSLWISASIATGSKTFGMVSEPKTVLYLDYEMTPDDLAERLEQMGYGEHANLDRLHYALLPSLPGLDEAAGGKAVVRMAELVDADLVVIDTFSRAVNGDENDADTVRAWYTNTGIGLKRAGRAFLRVDHAGKDIAKGQRGTSAKNDDVDVVWQMTAKEDSTYTLTAKKRRMGWVPERVDLAMNEDHALRFDLTNEHVWTAGTGELAARLEEAGIAADMSSRKACEAFRAAGGTARSQRITEAQKYRRNATATSYLADDTRYANTGEKGRGAVRGAVDSEEAGRAPGRTSDENDKTPGSDAGAHFGARWGAVADVPGAQCAPLKGAHADPLESETGEIEEITAETTPPAPKTPTEIAEELFAS